MRSTADFTPSCSNCERKGDDGLDRRVTLREQLIRDEGVRLKPYRDSVGLLTIGYGRCLDRKGISLLEAEQMLDHDLRDATADVLLHLPAAMTLDEPRRAVLVNMAFNLGIAGLLGFTKMLAAVATQDWDTAATEMLASKWAGQVGLRAERLAQQMASGEWT